MRSDVVVVGGGVIGLSCALRLRQAGLDVCVLERGVCGREASWAGAGMVAPANPHRTDPLYAIHTAGIDRYPEFCAELHELSGVDPEYIRCGAIELLTTEQFVEMARADVRAAADRRTEDGFPVLEMLSDDDRRALEPAVTGDALSASHCRISAQVRNPRLLSALRLACEEIGVTIHEHHAVRSLPLRKGRVAGAWTEHGTFASDHVILCAGAWSSRCAPPALAELIPVRPVKGQMVLLYMEDPPITRIVERRGTYLVPRNDGHILLGATVEPESGFDKRNTPAAISELMTDAMTIVPALREASVVATWAGLRPGTPDARPYIGPVPGHDGLIAATGHFRTGLTTAPVTAEIVRDIVVRGKSDMDLTRCAPGRRISGP